MSDYLKTLKGELLEAEGHIQRATSYASASTWINRAEYLRARIAREEKEMARRLEDEASDSGSFITVFIPPPDIDAEINTTPPFGVDLTGWKALTFPETMYRQYERALREVQQQEEKLAKYHEEYQRLRDNVQKYIADELGDRL